jgi:hypothetical protein
VEVAGIGEAHQERDLPDGQASFREEALGVAAPHAVDEGLEAQLLVRQPPLEGPGAQPQLPGDGLDLRDPPRHRGGE